MEWKEVDWHLWTHKVRCANPPPVHALLALVNSTWQLKRRFRKEAEVLRNILSENSNENIVFEILTTI